MLQGETSISTWVLHNLPQMYKDELKCFWQHIYGHHSPHYIISAIHNSQISCKMPDFWHPLKTWNDLLCYKELNVLLLKCFRTFLNCITMMKSFQQHIRAPYGQYHVIPTKNNSHISYITIPNFGHPLNKGNGMMCYKERHAMLLDCFITSPNSKTVAERAFWWYI